MSFNIWFVPTNSSHIGKNIGLLRRMREAGHGVRIICLDHLTEPINRTLEQIEKLDFQYETVPAGSYRTDCPRPLCAVRAARSLFAACQERKYPSIFKAFLLDRADKPDLLIFGSDVDPQPRAFIKTAKTLGIPGILIADGILPLLNPYYRPGFWKGLCERSELGMSHFLHNIALNGLSGIELAIVINDTSKRVLMQNGLAAGKIHVVGSPECVALANHLREMKEEDIRALRRRMGILCDRPVVTFAHQPLAGQKHMERMILKMVEGCRRADAMLLVKFHPRSNDYPRQWNQWAESQGLDQNQIVFFRNECSAQDAVIISTALITIFSTVALDALTCRRPMLLIQFLNTDRHISYAEDYGIALDVRREEDLVQSVTSIVKDENLRKRLLGKYPRAIDKLLNGLDGNVVEVIINNF